MSTPTPAPPEGYELVSDVRKEGDLFWSRVTKSWMPTDPKMLGAPHDPNRFFARVAKIAEKPECPEGYRPLEIGETLQPGDVSRAYEGDLRPILVPNIKVHIPGFFFRPEAPKPEPVPGPWVKHTDPEWPTFADEDRTVEILTHDGNTIKGTLKVLESFTDEDENGFTVEVPVFGIEAPGGPFNFSEHRAYRFWGTPAPKPEPTSTHPEFGTW